MTFSVRRLDGADVAAYRDIRLEGLRTEPASFGATVEEDAAIGDDGWAARLERNVTFGVFESAGIVGIATYYVEAGAKTAHRGHVVGVYVRPHARGSGAAGLLMQALIESAQQNVSHLFLVVTQVNKRAVRFYERIGFAVYGTDPAGLFVDGTMYEDYLMVLRLD